MKRVYELHFFSFLLISIVLGCQTPDSKKSEEAVITVAIGDGYILIDDSSVLLKNFGMYYVNKHKEKLKSIYPDTIYKVQLEVGEGTKLDKIMLVKNVLKKHHVKKIDIKIRQ